MDKETLTYGEQSALFERCMDAYRATEKYCIARSAITVHGHGINLIYPDDSWTAGMVRESGMDYNVNPEADAIRIYMADAGCRGFKMPASKVDRFRFSYRGDILGFEDGMFRATFFREAGAVSVVNLEDNSAVILFREKTAPAKESFLQVIVANLSLLMERSGVFFLPLKTMKCKEGAGLLTERIKGVDIFDPAELYLGKIKFSASWITIRREQSYIVQPFPQMGWPPEPATSLVSNLCIKGKIKVDNSVVPEMLKHRLICDTLNMLPFACADHIRFIETLFSDLPHFYDDSVKPSMPVKNITYPFSPFTYEHVKKTGKVRKYPKLSVIIPAYNAGSFLPEAVGSLLLLDHPDLELLIVDDGSDDNTKKVAQSLPVECRYFYQENRGPSAARNRGIRESKGDMILILDADDLINPSGVRYLIDILIKNPDFFCVKGYSQKFRISDTEETVFQGSPAESFLFYIGSAVFRRETFEKNGLFDEDLRLCEDTLWFTNAENRGLKIAQAEVISLFVRRHKANITLDSELHDLNLLKMLKKLT